jgi:subtilase family serine protease
MKHGRLWVLTGAVGLAVASTMVAGTAAVAASTPHRVALNGSLVPASERAHSAGSVAKSTVVSFDLLLTLRNEAGAAAFVKSVSTPGSADYHHYLSDRQWENAYGPTAASLATAKTWLKDEGFKIGALPKDDLFIPVSGTAAQVESAFGVTLNDYTVNGQTVRLSASTLTIPSALNGAVEGAVGVNQVLETTDLTTQATTTKAKPAQEPAPPAGFRNPKPCSAYWGQLTDTKDSGKLYKPYSHPLSYDICGYSPSQLRSAYDIPAKDDGAGVTIAIVDAYDSPTLLADAQKYYSLNDPHHPLTDAQFTNVEPATVDDQAECGGGGWYDEQALDVESSHAAAPAANIEFVGAQDCLDSSLLAALTTAVTSGASVVSDSWGDDVGDIFDDAATKSAYDDTFMLADSTGVSVLFSSGDEGDNFADFGLTAPDYPPSSPYVTAVGGTTLEVNKAGARAEEYGWSTAKQVLCEPKTTTCGTATTPTGSLAWQAGGGGGTSYYYTEPWYQDSVVPAALANRNDAFTGVATRVVPDISMDADAQSGFLIGLTQVFPNGTYYAQFKEGGTSLASPLLAGVVADTDQAAGVSLGFLNPIIYKAAADPGAINNILEPKNADSAAVIRVDYNNEVDNSDGYIVSLRAINYEGPETYCDGTGNCATRDVTLTTGPGYNSMTGLGSVGDKFIAILSRF